MIPQKTAGAHAREEPSRKQVKRASQETARRAEFLQKSATCAELRAQLGPDASDIEVTPPYRDVSQNLGLNRRNEIKNELERLKNRKAQIDAIAKLDQMRDEGATQRKSYDTVPEIRQTLQDAKLLRTAVQPEPFRLRVAEPTQEQLDFDARSGRLTVTQTFENILADAMDKSFGRMEERIGRRLQDALRIYSPVTHPDHHHNGSCCDSHGAATEHQRDQTDAQDTTELPALEHQRDQTDAQDTTKLPALEHHHHQPPAASKTKVPTVEHHHHQPPAASKTKVPAVEHQHHQTAAQDTNASAQRDWATVLHQRYADRNTDAPAFDFKHHQPHAARKTAFPGLEQQLEQSSPGYAAGVLGLQQQRQQVISGHAAGPPAWQQRDQQQTSGNATTPAFQLVNASTRADIINLGLDWTKIADPRERRRLQQVINSRRYRGRQLAPKKDVCDKAATESKGEPQRIPAPPGKKNASDERASACNLTGVAQAGARKSVPPIPLSRKTGKKARVAGVKAAKAARLMELHESEEEDVVLPQLGSKRASRTVINYALPALSPKLKKRKRIQTAIDSDDFIDEDDTDDFIDDVDSLDEDIAQLAQKPRKAKRTVDDHSPAPPAKKARKPRTKKPQYYTQSRGMQHSSLKVTRTSDECNAAIFGHPMIEIRCSEMCYQLFTLLGFDVPPQSDGKYDQARFRSILSELDCFPAFWLSGGPLCGRGANKFFKQQYYRDTEFTDVEVFPPGWPCPHCGNRHYPNWSIWKVLYVGCGMVNDEVLRRIRLGYEGSHRCGRAWCMNPLHRVYESKTTNNNRDITCLQHESPPTNCTCGEGSDERCLWRPPNHTLETVQAIKERLHQRVRRASSTQLLCPVFGCDTMPQPPEVMVQYYLECHTLRDGSEDHPEWQRREC